MTKEQRTSIDNGIWMCRTHGDLIDSDEARFTIEMLRTWRDVAELLAKWEHEGLPVDCRISGFKMPRNSVEIGPGERVNEPIGQALLDSCAHILWEADIADAVRDLLIETARNAFEHGQARKVTLQIEPELLRLVDDGRAFDPLTLIGKTSSGGGFVVETAKEVPLSRVSVY